MVKVEKISIKLSELRNISISLQKILSQDMSIKQAYRMSKLAKCADIDMKEIETQRMALVKKYGEKDEKGNITVTEKMQEFMNEFNELLNEEIEVSFIPIDLNDLSDVKLSPIDIANIEIFLDENSINLLENENVIDMNKERIAQHKQDMIM
jgi:hypothetical protein